MFSLSMLAKAIAVCSVLLQSVLCTSDPTSTAPKVKQATITKADFLDLCNKSVYVTPAKKQIDSIAVKEIVEEISKPSSSQLTSGTSAVDATKVQLKFFGDQKIDAFVSSALLKSSEMISYFKDPTGDIKTAIKSAITNQFPVYSTHKSATEKVTKQLSEIIKVIGENYEVSAKGIKEGKTTFTEEDSLKILTTLLFSSSSAVPHVYIDLSAGDKKVTISDKIVEIASKCKTTSNEAKEFFLGVLNCLVKDSTSGVLTKWSDIQSEMNKFFYKNGDSGLTNNDTEKGAPIEFLTIAGIIPAEHFEKFFYEFPQFLGDGTKFNEHLKRSLTNYTGESSVEKTILQIFGELFNATSLQASFDTLISVAEVAKTELEAEIKKCLEKVQLFVTFTEDDFKDKFVAPFSLEGNDLKWSDCPECQDAKEFETYISVVASKAKYSGDKFSDMETSKKASFVELFFKKENLEEFAKNPVMPKETQVAGDNNGSDSPSATAGGNKWTGKKTFYYIILPIAGGGSLVIIFVLIIKSRKNSKSEL